MSLAKLIRKRETGKPANANPAKAANDGQVQGAPLARLAKLALATPPESTNATPADARMDKVISKLHGDPGLRYAVEAHIDADADAVILTLAIRDKAACELRIPRDKYDPFLLLDLIERHTGKVH